MGISVLSLLLRLLVCCFLVFPIHSPLPLSSPYLLIVQLSSYSFGNFTTGAFPLSGLKKAINLTCLNPDSFKLCFTKT